MSSSPSRSPTAGSAGMHASGREQSPVGNSSGGSGPSCAAATGSSKNSHNGSKGLKMKIKRSSKTGGKIDGGKDSKPVPQKEDEEERSAAVTSNVKTVAGASESGAKPVGVPTPLIQDHPVSGGPNPSKNPGPFQHLKHALTLMEQQDKNSAKSVGNKVGFKTKPDGPQGGSTATQYNHTFSRSHVFVGQDKSPAIGSGGTVNKHKGDVYDFEDDRMGPVNSKKQKSEKDRAEMRDAATETCHAAVMTDPDCFGPCEPGTQVTLGGIVWQETDSSGLLVVNVTWRGKTYVGTLLDATKHEWAPPSFRSDSPQDTEARTPRSGRGKRGRTTMNSMGGRGTRTTRNSSCSTIRSDPPPSPAKSTASTSGNGEKRKAEGEPDEPLTPVKKPRLEFPMEPTVRTKARADVPWYVCCHPDCEKKFRDVNGLKFHQTSAHKNLILQLERLAEVQPTEPGGGTRDKRKKPKKAKSSDSQASPVKESVSPGAATSGKSGKNPFESSPEAKVKNAVIDLHPLVASGSMAISGGNSGISEGGKNVKAAPVWNIPKPDEAMDTGSNKDDKKKDKKDKKKKKKEKRKEKGEGRGDGEAPSLQPQTSHDGESSLASSGHHGAGKSSHSPQAPDRKNHPSKHPDLLPGSEAVQSPAYSDISDEGNDNVPVLENEVELARKQQSQCNRSSSPKDSGGESLPKAQEPPNLTPVIVHTGHTKSSTLPKQEIEKLPSSELPAAHRPSQIPETVTGMERQADNEKVGLSKENIEVKPHVTDKDKTPSVEQQRREMLMRQREMMIRMEQQQQREKFRQDAAALENEKILKENLEVKFQMTDKDRVGLDPHRLLPEQRDKLRLQEALVKKSPQDPKLAHMPPATALPSRPSHGPLTPGGTAHHGPPSSMPRLDSSPLHGGRPDRILKETLDGKPSQIVDKDRSSMEAHRMHAELLKQREMQRDLPRDMPRDLPRDLPRDVPRDLPRDMPRDLPRDLPRDVPRDLSRDMPFSHRQSFDQQRDKMRQDLQAAAIAKKPPSLDPKLAGHPCPSSSASALPSRAPITQLPPSGPAASVSRLDNSPLHSPRTKAELKQGAADRKDVPPPRSPAIAHSSARPEDGRPQEVKRFDPGQPLHAGGDRQDLSRPSSRKSPAPSPRMSSPMTPHQYPYHFLPNMLHSLQGMYPFYPYLPGYPHPAAHDPKAVDMLHLQFQAAQQQIRAQDLRKPDRRSPSGTEVDRAGKPAGMEPGQPSAIPRSSPQVSLPPANPWNNVPNGNHHMMQQSPPSSNKH